MAAHGRAAPRAGAHEARAGQGQAEAQAAAQAQAVAAQEEQLIRRAAQRRPAQFRRSPHLVCHWSERGLVVQNWAAGRSSVVPAFTVTLLDALGEWRSLASLARAFPGVGTGALGRAVNALRRASLVERAGARAPAAAAALEGWRAWSPAAALLHFSTKDVPFLEHGRGERLLARRAAVDPAPAPTRRAPRKGARRLPPAALEGEFPRVLLARRTWRRFARTALDQAALATLLRLTFGVQGWMPLRGTGPAPLKTSPSGGARHSIEAYVLARNVSGLAPGLYHYDAEGHALVRRRGGRRAAAVAAYLPEQPWFADAPVVVFMAAVFPRVQWRYDHPRAYRVVLAEAGHLCQTFLLTATWLGLAPFCTMALADSRIERALGLDGISESVLYAAGVGRRPHGARTGQRPR